jgi:hypothetical protein
MKCTSVGDQQIEAMVERTQKLGSWDPILWEFKRAWTGKYAQDLVCPFLTNLTVNIFKMTPRRVILKIIAPCNYKMTRLGVILSDEG